MTLALGTKPLLILLVVLLFTLALVGVLALDQVLHLGLLHALPYLPAWGSPSP